MSRAEIERFVNDVRANRALLGEVARGVIGLSHFVDKAKAAGYDFTVEEAKEYIRDERNAHITDAELEAVVGGGVANTNVATETEVVTEAFEASHVTTTSNVELEVEGAVGVVAIGVIVAS